MHLNYTALIVPLFCLFVWIEYRISVKKGLHIFTQGTTLSNVHVGILERLTDVIAAGSFYGLYVWLYEQYALFHFEPKWWMWIVLLLITDFIWYWYHRLAHEFNVFWSVHVVHHQSDAFNYSVSARITLFQAVLRTSFWAIMPIMGFPPHMIAVMLMIHGAYPFFTHTQVVGKLGWLEYILVTPSHHRVHHACNPEYLDKNYGDIFIIWDKLFGTFQQERDDIQIKYGLTHEVKSYSILWQHFHFTLELWSQLNRTRGWREKVKLLFSSPAVILPEIRQRIETRFHISNDGLLPNAKLTRYVTIQGGLLLTTLFFFLLFEQYISTQYSIAYAFWVLSTLLLNGAILEQKRWIFYLEIARLAGVAGILLYPFNAALGVAILATVLLVSANLRWVKLKYITWLVRG